MKSIQRFVGLTVLSVAFVLPAIAVEDASLTAARKRVPVVRESKGAVLPPARPGDLSYTDQSGQVVYQVLLAEIALRRGDLELASKAYADLSLRTRDPKVLERTIEVAGYARRFDLALEAARLWIDVDPDAKRPQQLLVSMLVMANQLDELAPNLIRLLELEKELLASNLLGLNRLLARTPDRLAVFRLVDRVCAPYIGIAEAHYAVALAASSAGARERALAETQRALELRPDWEAAVFLKAQLLSRDSPSEAISFLQDFVERNPNAREVQLQLARALIGEKRYSEAKRHFDQLLQAYPDSPEVVYPVAILALQHNDRGLAEAQLRHFLTLNVQDKNSAYYYLGQIAEEAKRDEEALGHYAQVLDGENYLPAQLRQAHILAKQGRLDPARKQLREAKARTAEERVRLLIVEAGLLREARQTQAAFDLLEQALSAQPDQPDLLYETALLAERLGRMDVLESHLRKLIELRPDSAQAYNALGYSFAERNLRLPEARELIEKALSISPNDSFILDSMGWLLYRQGDLSGALRVLERAYAQREDPEIAAHMGEVLWSLGQKDDARRFLQEVLKKHPSNDVLIEAARKFAP